MGFENRPKDFFAKQIRSSHLIASGGIIDPASSDWDEELDNLRLMIYPRDTLEKATSATGVDYIEGAFEGIVPPQLLNDQDGTGLKVGNDVWLFISGAQRTQHHDANDDGILDDEERENRANNGIVLFGGDVVISGTLFAERQVIEVDLSQEGELFISGNLIAQDYEKGIHFVQFQGPETGYPRDWLSGEDAPLEFVSLYDYPEDGLGAIAFDISRVPDNAGTEFDLTNIEHDTNSEWVQRTAISRGQTEAEVIAEEVDLKWSTLNDSVAYPYKFTVGDLNIAITEAATIAGVTPALYDNREDALTLGIVADVWNPGPTGNGHTLFNIDSVNNYLSINAPIPSASLDVRRQNSGDTNTQDQIILLSEPGDLIGGSSTPLLSMKDGNTGASGHHDDTAFYVWGVPGGKAEFTPGANPDYTVGVFGGDLVVSGALYSESGFLDISSTHDHIGSPGSDPTVNPDVPGDGTVIGTLQFSGTETAGDEASGAGARIEAEAAEDWSPGDIPARLNFFTNHGDASWDPDGPMGTSAEGTDDGLAMTIDHHQTVGIGTEVPMAKLHVSSTSSLDSSHQLLLHEADTGFSRLSFTNEEDTSGPFGQSHEWTIAAKSKPEGSNIDARMNFYYGDGDNAGTGIDHVVITGAGQVGVGTPTSTGPSARIHAKIADTAETLALLESGDTPAKLHIKSDNDAVIILEADALDGDEDNNPYIQFLQDAGAHMAIMGLVGSSGEDPEGNPYTDTLSNSLLIGGEDASSSVDPHLQLGTKDVVRMTVRRTGETGIGTNDPNQHVEIQKDDIQLRLSHDVSNYIDFEVDSNGDLDVTGSSTSNIRHRVSVHGADSGVGSAGFWGLVDPADVSLGYLDAAGEALATNPLKIIGLKEDATDYDDAGTPDDPKVLVVLEDGTISYKAGGLGGGDDNSAWLWPDTDGIPGGDKVTLRDETNKVGIGTGDPMQKVHVYGGETSNAAIRIESNETDAAGTVVNPTPHAKLELSLDGAIHGTLSQNTRVGLTTLDGTDTLLQNHSSSGGIYLSTFYDDSAVVDPVGNATHPDLSLNVFDFNSWVQSTSQHGVIFTASAAGSIIFPAVSGGSRTAVAGDMIAAYREDGSNRYYCFSAKCVDVGSGIQWEYKNGSIVSNLTVMLMGNDGITTGTADYFNAGDNPFFTAYDSVQNVFWDLDVCSGGFCDQISGVNTFSPSSNDVYNNLEGIGTIVGGGIDTLAPIIIDSSGDTSKESLQVLILSGTYGNDPILDPRGFDDTNFYVSGSIGSCVDPVDEDGNIIQTGNGMRGTAVFGGDVYVSGTIFGANGVVGAGGGWRTAMNGVCIDVFADAPGGQDSTGEAPTGTTSTLEFPVDANGDTTIQLTETSGATNSYFAIGQINAGTGACFSLSGGSASNGSIVWDANWPGAGGLPSGIGIFIAVDYEWTASCGVTAAEFVTWINAVNSSTITASLGGLNPSGNTVIDPSSFGFTIVNPVSDISNIHPLNTPAQPSARFASWGADGTSGYTPSEGAASFTGDTFTRQNWAQGLLIPFDCKIVGYSVRYISEHPINFPGAVSGEKVTWSIGTLGGGSDPDETASAPNQTLSYSEYPGISWIEWSSADNNTYPMKYIGEGNELDIPVFAGQTIAVRALEENCEVVDSEYTIDIAEASITLWLQGGNVSGNSGAMAMQARTVTTVQPGDAQATEGLNSGYTAPNGSTLVENLYTPSLVSNENCLCIDCPIGDNIHIRLPNPVGLAGKTLMIKDKSGTAGDTTTHIQISPESGSTLDQYTYWTGNSQPLRFDQSFACVMLWNDGVDWFVS